MQDTIEVKKSDKKEKVAEIRKKMSTKAMLTLVLAVLLVGAGGSAVYFYKKYNEVKSNPTQAQTDKNKAETQRVLDKLKSALLITDTEQPTVARVEDVAKLQTANKEFYKDVQKGDYLVIYPKRAIIYREANDQIINVAPIINTADLQKAKEQSGTQPASTTTPASNSTTKTTR